MVVRHADELLRALAGLELKTVSSDAIRRLGYDPRHRMVGVVFTSSDEVYGYPLLSDEEIAGLLAVLQNHESLGHYVSTVIKKNHDHDHERVQL
jgi:hypothetical protein